MKIAKFNSNYYLFRGDSGGNTRGGNTRGGDTRGGNTRGGNTGDRNIRVGT